MKQTKQGGGLRGLFIRDGFMLEALRPNKIAGHHVEALFYTSKIDLKTLDMRVANVDIILCLLRQMLTHKHNFLLNTLHKH